MSTPIHDSQTQPPVQEVDLNDTAWNEVVATKLPADLEEQHACTRLGAENEE